RMEIQMDEAAAATREDREPCRGRQLVQPPMERGERGGVPAVGPKPLLKVLEHGGTHDAILDQLGAVGAPLLDTRRRISPLGDVAHGRRFLLHRTTASRATQHEARTVVEDLRIAAGGEQRTWLAHGCYSNASSRRRLVAATPANG